MAKKQSWSKLADSFEFDPEQDTTEEEQKQFVETSRQEELAKAAKSPSLDKYMNVRFTTKILARLGFKGAVEKVQLYHESKNERIEKEKATREAAKATKGAAESQTREAVSNEQGLNSYAESTLKNRGVVNASEGQAWMAKYIKAGQEAVKKLEANEAEFKAQIEAQGLAMERMVSMKKQAEQEQARQAEVAEHKAEEEEVAQIEPRFLQSMEGPIEETNNVLQQSMVEGDQGYDPELESTTKSDITELTDGIEDFVDSKAGSKLESENPELVAAMELANKETIGLLKDIDEVVDQSSDLQAQLDTKEVTKETITEMSAAISTVSSLEGRIAKISRLLDAPEGIIDQLNSIKRPGKDIKNLKASLENASARLVKLEEVKNLKDELKKKLPEAVTMVASKIDVAKLPEQKPEQRLAYQVRETLNEAEQKLGKNREIMNDLSKQGGDLLESEEKGRIISVVPIAMNRIRELSSSGTRVSFMIESANEQIGNLEKKLQANKLDKTTVVEMGNIISSIEIVEQSIKNLKEELNRELSASDLLSHIIKPDELTAQYQETLKQAKEANGQTNEFDELKAKLTEQLGQTVGLLAEQAGQDKEKMIWDNKVLNWEAEAAKPAKTEVYIDEDEFEGEKFDEALMKEIDAELKREIAIEQLLAERRGTEYGEQPEIDETELEAMEKLSEQKYEFGDRVFIETFGLKLGGEVKAYTNNGKVEVRFDDGQRQVFNEDQLQKEPVSEKQKAEEKPIRLLSKEEQDAGVEGTDLDEPYHAAEDSGDVPTTIKRRKKIKPEDIDKQLTA